MIEGVAAVERAGAVSIAAASGLAARNGRMWREKRLKFLGALRAAAGDAGALGDEIEEEGALEPRARIAEAQERIALLGAEVSGWDESDFADTAVDAASVARRLGEGGPRSIALQARIGALSVARLVADGSR